MKLQPVHEPIAQEALPRYYAILRSYLKPVSNIHLVPPIDKTGYKL